MSTRKRLLFTSGIFAVSGIFCIGAFAETDFQYWNEESIEVGLTDKLSAEIDADFRFKDDAGKHYYTATSLELNYEFLKWLEGGVGYKQKYELKKDEWKGENRPYIQGALKWKLAEWKFKNRARVEYRMKQGGDDIFRFRDKLTLKSPWKWTALEINPFVADEIFIQEKDSFYKNRTYAGAGCKLVEHVYLELFYLLEVEKDDGAWDQYIHGIGTELKLKF